MSRIRWKLLLAMLAVVALTVGLSGFLTGRVAHEQVRRLLVVAEVRGAPAPAGALEERYRAQGWERIEKRVAAGSPAPRPGEIAALDLRLFLVFGGATLAAVLLALLVSRRITSPLERLTAGVQAMARGGLPARVAVSGRDEIAQLARAFNAMADALAAQEQVRRRMVTDVAHELRTPLTNLRCELEAIQDGLAAPDGARLGSLHEEVLHLGRLVDDLQELALADAGALTLQRERVDLGATVRRLAELRRADGVDLEIEANAPVTVHADPLRIRQILGNLLANAVRHTPAGGRIRVAVRREGGDAVVEVSDSGAGIPAAELERIFEPFYRLDAARTRARADAGDAGGAGLGLAIVRRLVELHGGRVWATSAPDGGATFVVAIPRAAPA